MEKNVKLLLISASTIILFAIIYFLFQSDPGGISGFRALGLLDSGFWIPVAICTLAAVAVSLFAIKRSTTSSNVKSVIALFVVAVVLFFAPWGKACTVKADPVQAPKYKNK